MISWDKYFVYVGMFLLVYYGVTFLFIAIRKIKTAKQGGQVGIDRNEFLSLQVQGQEKDVQKEDAQKSLSDELNAFFSEASQDEWEKEELLGWLSRIVSKYPSIGGDNEKLIVQQIAALAEQKCSIQFSDGDLKVLWAKD